MRDDERLECRSPSVTTMRIPASELRLTAPGDWMPDDRVVRDESDEAGIDRDLVIYGDVYLPSGSLAEHVDETVERDLRDARGAAFWRSQRR